MKAEIIAIGSELLLGQITNTNAKFMAERLAEVGIDVHYQTVVGDNAERLKEVIRIAQNRANVLIFSGGLGPTKDDVTKETIAQLLQVPLVKNEAALQTIQNFFQRTGRVMTANNEKQALVLEGAHVLPNDHGMAPGMAIEKAGVRYVLLPGPPHELEPMFVQEAIPYLLDVVGQHETIFSKVLKFYGIGEAELEDRIQSILDHQTNPTIAPLASPDGVTLRLTAKAATIEQAAQLMEPVEKAIRLQVGPYLYGVNNETLASRAATLLKEKKMTVAAAESLTAGLFLAELAEEPGISRVMNGGLIVYDKREKEQQLMIPSSLLEEHGVVSAECAAALAQQVRKKFHASIGIGLTGVAGPDAHDGQPVGTVWIGIASENRLKTYHLALSGTRNANRRRSAQYALYYLIQFLKEISE